MQIDWNKIKKECPESYNKYLNFIFNKNIIKYILNDEDLEKNIEDLIEESCYCDLEKFFDDNMVIIVIEFDYNNFEYRIDNFNNEPYYKPVNSSKSRQEAKEQAIYKAFEIMEQKRRKVDK